MQLIIFILTLTFGISAFSANDRILTHDLQNILERNQVLGHMNRQESCQIAYTELHRRLGSIIGPIDAHAPARLAAKTAEQNKKARNISSSLINFSGWSKRAQALMAASHRSYADYLRLMNIMRPHCEKESHKNNLSVAEVRFRRLDLESRRVAGQTYEDMDPGSALRQQWYAALSAIKNGVKVRLVEQADLIVACGYSPTGDERDDLTVARDLMNAYFDVKEGNARNDRYAPHAPRSSMRPAVPYVKQGNEQSDIVQERARMIRNNIQLRLAQLDGGAAHADDGSDADDNHGHGFDPDGNNSMSGDSSDDDNDDLGGDLGDAHIVLGNAHVINATMGVEGSNHLNQSVDTMHAHEATGGDSLHTELDHHPDANIRTGMGLASESEEEEIKVSNKRVRRVVISDSEESDTEQHKRRIVISSENEESDSDNEDNSDSSAMDPGKRKAFSRSRKAVSRKAVTEEKNQRILAALESNPEMSFAQIAEIAAGQADDINYFSVLHYVNTHAPQFKKKQWAMTDIAAKDERVRLAVAANPAASHAHIAEIAGEGITKSYVDGWFSKLGLTKKMTPKEDVERKRNIVLALKAANPDATSTEIEQLAKKEGHHGITRTIVHKAIARTEYKQPKSKTPALTQAQKDQIEVELSGNIDLPHKDVAKKIGCKPNQVSKYANAKGLKKRTNENYVRRSEREISQLDIAIKAHISSNKEITNKKIIDSIYGVDMGYFHGFYKRNPKYLVKNRDQL